MKRGQVWFAKLGSREGSEQAGERPVLIIQNNVGNQFSPTVIVASITDGGKKFVPTHVQIDPRGGLSKPSTILLEQIRTIDKTKLANYVCTLPADVMKEVESKILISLGITK